MSIRRWFMFGITLAMSTMAYAAFEGEVDYEVVNSKIKGRTLVTYQIKGAYMRTTIRQENGRVLSIMLFRPDTQTYYMLNPITKTATQQNLGSESIDIMGIASGMMDKYQKTNRTDRIAGYPCTVYTYKDNLQDTEACNAEGKDLAIPLLAQQINKKKPSKMPSLALRVVTKTGGTTITSTVKRIQKKSLLKSVFDIPADYKTSENVLDAMGTADADTNAFVKKLQNASPAEREKMIRDFEKKYQDEEAALNWKE